MNLEGKIHFRIANSMEIAIIATIFAVFAGIFAALEETCPADFYRNAAGKDCNYRENPVHSSYDGTRKPGRIFPGVLFGSVCKILGKGMRL